MIKVAKHQLKQKKLIIKMFEKKNTQNIKSNIQYTKTMWGGANDLEYLINSLNYALKRCESTDLYKRMSVCHIYHKHGKY